jgi:hypothetical protein
VPFPGNPRHPSTHRTVLESQSWILGYRAVLMHGMAVRRTRTWSRSSHASRVQRWNADAPGDLPPRLGLPVHDELQHTGLPLEHGMDRVELFDAGKHRKIAIDATQIHAELANLTLSGCSIRKSQPTFNARAGDVHRVVGGRRVTQRPTVSTRLCSGEPTFMGRGACRGCRNTDQDIGAHVACMSARWHVRARRGMATHKGLNEPALRGATHHAAEMEFLRSVFAPRRSDLPGPWSRTVRSKQGMPRGC